MKQLAILATLLIVFLFCGTLLTPSLAASPLTSAASPSPSFISRTTESTKEQKFLRSEQIETVLRFVLVLDDIRVGWCMA